MKKYKVSDIFEGSNKNVNYYKNKFDSLLKIEKIYHKVGSGCSNYTTYEVYRFSPKRKTWYKLGTLNQHQLVEQCKELEKITSAEAFIEIL